MELFNKYYRMIVQGTVTTFVLIMVGIYPLYYDNKYYNIGEAKYLFVRNLSLVVFSSLLVITIISLILNYKSITWGNIKKKISLVDLFVMIYAVAATISYVLTPYKTTAFWGYEGWYMGLYSQWLFILIYFYVSRHLKAIKSIVILGIASSAIVFVLAIFHRFQIDPLHLYEDLSMDSKILFLTTIGQATWYSSYLCIIFPIGVFLFWKVEQLYLRILLGIYVVIGFATIVTQNSDSAFIATGIMLFILFCYSFKEIHQLKRTIEVIILGLISFSVIGMIQKLFQEYVIPLEPLSLFFSQSHITKQVLASAIIGYVVIRYFEKKGGWGMNPVGIIPKMSLLLALIGLVIMIGIIYLTTTNQLPPFLEMLYEVDYLNFNDAWGNGRGFTWKISSEIFNEYPIRNQLFGCGPDCFADYGYERYEAALNEMWGGNVLTNAHNEWFTSLLFFGIFGAISYSGIFISQGIGTIRDSNKNPYLIAITMAIFSYMGHNFFCYQQIVCTPLIFIIMGVGESMRRKVKNIV